jgi:septum formation protein
MNIVPAGKTLILASKSPRRKALLQDMGIPFEARSKSVEEVYPPQLKGAEIAEYLAHLKARAFAEELTDKEIVLSSDTVVWCNNTSLAKAHNKAEAATMLSTLSGKSHQVITGVCLLSKQKTAVFSDTTTVHFNTLEEAEIEHYIQTYEPFDKAGAYGIQEWIGMIGIQRIEGSYFTVMGLPTHLVYQKLRSF